MTNFISTLRRVLRRRPAALVLLLLAAALLAAGILLGENGLVQRNAHYLCLDCLGIG